MSSSGSSSSSGSTSTSHYAVVGGTESLPLSQPQQYLKKHVEELIHNIYKSHAELYPNPQLVQEKLARDALVQEIRKELLESEKEVAETKEGDAGAAGAVITQPKKKGFFSFLFGSTTNKVAPVSTTESMFLEDDYIMYTDVSLDNGETNTLCGTSSVLDTSCIPPEAHSLARMVLSSSSSPLMHDQGQILVMALGVLAEYQENQWIVYETSDKEELEQHANILSLSRTRATRIAHSSDGSSSCCAISWGDGLVIFYRRNNNNKINQYIPVAMVAPTPAVLENLQSNDMFMEEFSSQLQVSDLVPLVVETPDPNVPAATLVISRLGGYIEFIPLPLDVWQGPVPAAPPKRQKKKGGQQHHYAMGHLYNLVAEGNALALTIGPHLEDVLHMQIHRTNVGVDTEWKEGDAPPAEYLLLASGGGAGKRNGTECITFWAVATVFSEDGGFGIHVRFLEEISMGSVGCVSIFADDDILQHWRRPRKVQRKHTTGQDESSSNSIAGTVGTVTTPAPLRLLQFQRISDDRLVLAVLDYNGGISLLDCSSVLDMATTCQSPADDGTITTQVVRSRDEMKHHLRGALATDLAWSCTPNEMVVSTSTNQLYVLGLDSSFNISTCQALRLPKWVESTQLGKQTDHLSLFMSRGSRLIMAELQLASPKSILLRLLKSCKYAEALAAAEGFPDQHDLVTTCHKRLWETKHAVQHLAAISDNAYVIEQVVAIFQGDDDNDDENISDLTGLDMTSCRQACHLAFKACSTIRVASALQLSEEVDVIKEKLVKWSIRGGTYSLLCQHIGAEESITAFLEQFVHMPLVGLASQMATKGDMKALTLILTRHWKELADERLTLLEKIPLSVEPSEFAHLLPVHKEGHDCVDFFVVESDDSKDIQPFTEIFHFANEELGYPILMEGEDLSMFQANENPDGVLLLDVPSRSDLAVWFVERAKQMQKFVGALTLLLSFCDLAIKCLGVALVEGQADVDQLLAIRAFTQHMDEMLISGDYSSHDTEVQMIDIEDLANVPISTLIGTLLGRPKSELEASSRFSRHVLPVLSLPGIADKGVAGISNDVLDEALVLHCSDLLTPQAADEENERLVVRSIRDSMLSFVSIVQASRSTLPVDERLIKSRQTLAKLVLLSSEKLARWCSKARLLSSDTRDLVNKMWQTYECLPAGLPPQEEEIEEFIALEKRLDKLYLVLIAADLLSNWSYGTTMALFSKDSLNGPEIASAMCNAFCKEISAGNKTYAAKVELLSNLATDLVQLKDCACLSSLDLEPALHEVLLMGLLQQGEFELFVEVFSSELASIADWERMQPPVLNFVNEAMFGDENGSSSRFSFETDKVHTAIQCQDILGSRFPQLQHAFGGMRRHLDAAHFIKTVLCVQNITLSPSELREMMPFDIVEHVLEANPLVIMHDCDDWVSADYGATKIQELASVFLSRHGTNTSISMPLLPGGAVIHLANIVGLEFPGAHLLILHRMVHYAKIANLPWVGAALAFSMMKSDAQDQPKLNDLKVDAVAMVVSDDTYDDVIAKYLLCSECLCLTTSSEGTSSIGCILKAFGALEHKVSRFCPSMWQAQTSSGQPQRARKDLPDQGASEFLVFRAAGILANKAKTIVNHDEHDEVPLHANTLFDRLLTPRPIDRVFQDTMAGYSTDLNSLFQILQNKASEGQEDDPLLHAIARLYLFWCISNSVRVVEHDCHGTFEQSDAFENLSIGTSLFLHARDRDAILSNVEEMKEIAEVQSVSAIEQAAAGSLTKPARPDLGIVRKLIEMGYTENGARRAAVMTNNESQQAAMLWAVANSGEHAFDAPLIFVKPIRSSYIDQSAIRNVKRSIYMVERRFKEADASRTSSMVQPVTEEQVHEVDYAHLAQVLTPDVMMDSAEKSSEVQTEISTPSTPNPDIQTAAQNMPLKISAAQAAAEKEIITVRTAEHALVQEAGPSDDFLDDAQEAHHTQSAAAETNSSESHTYINPSQAVPQTEALKQAKENNSNKVGSQTKLSKSTTSDQNLASNPRPEDLGHTTQTREMKLEAETESTEPRTQTPAKDAATEPTFLDEPSKPHTADNSFVSEVGHSSLNMESHKGNDAVHAAELTSPPTENAVAKSGPEIETIKVLTPDHASGPVLSSISRELFTEYSISKDDDTDETSKKIVNAPTSVEVRFDNKSGSPLLDLPTVNESGVTSTPRNKKVPPRPQPPPPPSAPLIRVESKQPSPSSGTQAEPHANLQVPVSSLRVSIPQAPQSAPAALDRSALRMTGELVRRSSRGLSNRLDHEERKRLLSKGMQLFAKARGSPTTMGTPRTPTLKLSAAAMSPRPPPPPPPPPSQNIPKPKVLAKKNDSYLDDNQSPTVPAQSASQRVASLSIATKAKQPSRPMPPPPPKTPIGVKSNSEHAVKNENGLVCHSSETSIPMLEKSVVAPPPKQELGREILGNETVNHSRNSSSSRTVPFPEVISSRQLPKHLPNPENVGSEETGWDFDDEISSGPSATVTLLPSTLTAPPPSPPPPKNVSKREERVPKEKRWDVKDNSSSVPPSTSSKLAAIRNLFAEVPPLPPTKTVLNTEVKIIKDTGWDFDDDNSSVPSVAPPKPVVSHPVRLSAPPPPPPSTIVPKQEKNIVAEETGWDFDDDDDDDDTTSELAAAATKVVCPPPRVLTVAPPPTKIQKPVVQDTREDGWDFEDDDISAEPTSFPNAQVEPDTTNKDVEDDVEDDMNGDGWDFDDFEE